MKFIADKPESTQASSFLEEYEKSLAESYASYLDSVVFKHMNRFEKFLATHKIYWPLRLFSRYTITFNLRDRTQTVMKGKKKIVIIKGF